MRKHARWILLVAGLAAVLLAPAAARIWRAQRLLRSMAAAPAAPSPEVRSEEVTIPGRGKAIRARLYLRADGSGRQGLVVAHGVHHQGIDEKRLVPFARELARSGLVVLTPALDDLADYRIDARSVGELTDSVVYLGGRTDLVDQPRVGLLGFSFGGGLALLAAGEPLLRDRLSHVVSIGGYHDLGRVLRFFLSGMAETPDGPVAARPHEYGPLVLLYRHLDRLVPARDRQPLREVVRAWLREEFPRARSLAEGLASAEARDLYALIDGKALDRLRPRLEALLADDAATLEALSPRDKLSRIAAPVYLLHGQGDTVIPASEVRWANAELGPHDHLALISPLLEHVEVSRQASFGDQLDLLLFMSRML
jgi:dienelactone hydrolase